MKISLKIFDKKRGNIMKKYVKPVLVLKTITTSDDISAGFEGWLGDNGLADVGITKAVLTLDVNS